MSEEKAHVVVLSGVFYQNPDTDLLVADEDLGAVALRSQLEPMAGKLVSLVAHHCPPEPPNRQRWGGGSCLFQPTGQCPCGHQDRPDWLYQCAATGLLQYESDRWSVRKADGGVVEIHTEWLVGHYSQILATALPNVEDLQESVRQEMENPTVEGLQSRIAQLRGLLSMVNQQKDSL